MKQKLLQRTLLLLFALIAGSTSVWADFEPVYTLSCVKNSSNSAYANYYDVTINGLDWNAPGNQNIEGCWRIGGKATDSSTPLNANRIITGKSQITSAISKVTFNHNGKSRANVGVPSVTLTIASDADFNTVIDEVVVNPTIAKDTEGSFDFTPTSPLTEWTANCYYKITINVTNSDTSNGGLDVTSIVFYKTVADKTVTATAISDGSLTNTDLKNGTTAGSLSASVTAGGSPVGGATVTWESSDPTVATINASTGVVTLVAVGATTITATYAGNATYYGSSDTYDLTVTDTRVATVTAIDDSGLTNTDVFNSTTAGQLTASVTAGGSPVGGASVTWESSDPAVATIDTEGNVTLVKAGSTTITATYAGGGSYAASFDTYDLTVTDSNAPLLNESVSKYTSDSDSSTKITDSNKNTYLDEPSNWDAANFTNAYPGKNGCFKLGTSSKTGSVKTSAIALTGCGKLTFKVKRYSSSETGPLNVTVTGATASGDVSVTAGSDFASYTVNLINATGSVVITFATSSKRIYLDDIKLVKVEKVPVTITTADYATFCSAFDLDFSTTGITVYKAKVESNKVKFTEVTGGLVKAGEGVLLYKDVDASTVVDVPVTTGVAALSENELVGVTADTEVSYGTGPYNYILQMNGANLVFRKATGAKLRANRAYLSTDYDVTTSGARELEVVFGDETAIQSIDNGQLTMDNVIYDLAGRRVENPTKGIYIMNGKKVVIK